MTIDEMFPRRYWKFRYGNRLYTRKQAGELGRTFLDEDGTCLHVYSYGWHCVMHLQECAYGQKYVEEDSYLRKRDRFIEQMKNQ